MRPAVLRAALLRPAGLALLGAAALAACSPTVRVEAPKEPIRIDLNVRIEQEVRVRVDRELEDVFADNEDIF
jgi:hypothetical protein